MKSRAFKSLLFAVCFGTLEAQPLPVFDRVEPANWWVGMKNSELQVLFYSHDNVSSYQASLNYPGVSIKEKIKVENPHYLFLKLQITRNFPFA